MKKLAMGIDIGGTNTAFGLVDDKGTIFCEGAISTERYKRFEDYEAYVKALCEAMQTLIAGVSFDFELLGIGIGAPNANYHEGTIETPANLWKFSNNEPNPDESRRMFRFVEDVKRYFPQTEVVITNDANAAAIGEGVFGNAKGMDDYVVITLGTGLGSGIVSNGEMIYGHDGFAGEYGHIMVESRSTGRECGCGRKGCLEAYASATGIKRTAFELMAKMTCQSELREVPYSKFEAVMLSAAADKGDAIAREAFRFTGEVLGKALADLVATTSPKAIILFGGLAKAGKHIFEPTKWYMEENMLPVFKNKVALLPSGIEGRNAAILGSAALIWQKQK
jgi:glucokinase